MKKQLSILLILLFATVIQAQVPFTTYHNSYHGFENPIFMSLSYQSFTLWISGLPVGERLQTGGIAIKENQYQSFYDRLNFARQEYTAWKNDLQNGKHKEINKSLHMFVNADAFFKTGEWYYENNLMLKFDLVADISEDSNAYYLIVRTGNLKSSYYGTSVSGGFEIVFSDENEILQFLNCISRENINKQIALMNPLSEKIKQQIIEKRIQKAEKRPWLSHIEYGVTTSFTSTFNMNKKNVEPPLHVTNNETFIISYDGFSGGIFGRIYFKSIVIQPEIMYSNFAGKNHFTFFDPTFETIIMLKSITQKTLEVPLLAGYNIWNKNRFKISILAGPQFSFDMGSGSKITYYHTQGNYGMSSESETMHSFRTGITTAATFDYSRFSLGIRYNTIANKFETTFDSRLFDKMAVSSLTFTAAWKIFEPIK
jgi:hypothetical protein